MFSTHHIFSTGVGIALCMILKLLPMLAFITEAARVLALLMAQEKGTQVRAHMFCRLNLAAILQDALQEMPSQSYSKPLSSSQVQPQRFAPAP